MFMDTNNNTHQIDRVGSMLVTDVGDSLYWWQVWDSSNQFEMVVDFIQKDSNIMILPPSSENCHHHCHRHHCPVFVHEFTRFFKQINHLKHLMEVEATRINWLWPEIIFSRSSGNFVCIRTLYLRHQLHQLNSVWLTGAQFGLLLEPINRLYFNDYFSIVFLRTHRIRIDNQFDNERNCYRYILKIIVLVSENNKLFTLTVASWWS